MNRGELPFAVRVRRRMAERGLGLREVCRAVGLDPSFFSKVLSGKRSPPSDEEDLRRLARVLELDAAGLIVAAGRIPGEWRGLWRDAVLFEEVHRLASGASDRAPGAPAFPQARPGRSPSGLGHAAAPATALEAAARPSPKGRGPGTRALPGPPARPEDPGAAAQRRFGEELL